MAPRRETAAARAQGKRPAEPSETEARRKARFDTHLFSTAEEHQRYKNLFAKRTILPGRDIDFVQLSSFGFQDLFARMGWLPLVALTEPIFPTLVRTFYSKLQIVAGGPISCTLQGVEIELDADSICQILDVPAVGHRVFEFKTWPNIPGFDVGEAIQRLCGLPQPNPVGKPSASSLTVPSRVLHHITCQSIVPRAGHRDEVSYFEAFLIDCILTGRRVHLGHVMLHHMIGCCESRSRALPYGRFLTKVFKVVGIDLSRERDTEVPSPYDTYNALSMTRMKIEQGPDGRWRRKAEIPPGVDEEDEIRGMEAGGDHQGDIGPDAPEPQPTFTEPAPSQPMSSGSLPIPTPWSELSTQISSLGSRMEELALASEQRSAYFDTRLQSFGQRIDAFERTTAMSFQHVEDQVSAHYAHIQGRLEFMEEGMAQILAYIRGSQAPPPPPPQD